MTKDVFDILESQAEQWVEGDNFKCINCECWKDLEYANTTSVNPYSALICSECLEKVNG